MRPAGFSRMLTDMRTDGQTLLQRCEDASKNKLGLTDGEAHPLRERPTVASQKPRQNTRKSDPSSLTSRRGSPVVLRVELLDGLLDEGGAIAFDFERNVALLSVAQFLHLSAELHLFDREAA